VRPFSMRAEMADHLARRDGDRCQLCGGPFGKGFSRRTLDHIIPRSKGGTNHPANLQLAHFRCNHQRGCAMPREDVVARIQAAVQGQRVVEAWREAGVEMNLRRCQRRSRYVRALRRDGKLQPGEIVVALAAVLDADAR
jgi:HNH endonuclease